MDKPVDRLGRPLKFGDWVWVHRNGLSPPRRLLAKVAQPGEPASILEIEGRILDDPVANKSLELL